LRQYDRQHYTAHKSSNHKNSMKPLTDRQQDILNFIERTLLQDGFPPTIAEIAAAFGVRSTNSIRGHLQALARKGAIELVPAASRGIRLLKPTPDPNQGLPLVGRVAAGQPILAEEHIERYCRLGPELFDNRADYLLRVQGMSMRDAGILDGDLLAVQRTPEARNGQIVVARIHDEATVKRLRLDSKAHMAYLEPANPDFRVIEVDLQREPLVIEGVVVGVIRSGL
jgi:repressor LexA